MGGSSKQNEEIVKKDKITLDEYIKLDYDQQDKYKYTVVYIDDIGENSIYFEKTVNGLIVLIIILIRVIYNTNVLNFLLIHQNVQYIKLK
jgi:hypothetical protein